MFKKGAFLSFVEYNDKSRDYARRYGCSDDSRHHLSRLARDVGCTYATAPVRRENTWTSAFLDRKACILCFLRKHVHLRRTIVTCLGVLMIVACITGH